MMQSTSRAQSPPVTVPRRAAEWLARVEQDAVASEQRRALARASGIRDEETLEGLRQLGVTPASLPALDLAPAVLVGWSDGVMSRLERDRFRVLALRQGLGEGHAAWALLNGWLLHRPSPRDEHVLLESVTARLGRLPARARFRKRAAILRDCEAVARAAGRVLGGPKICPSERDALARMAARLGE